MLCSDPESALLSGPDGCSEESTVSSPPVAESAWQPMDVSGMRGTAKKRFFDGDLEIRRCLLFLETLCGLGSPANQQGEADPVLNVARGKGMKTISLPALVRMQQSTRFVSPLQT